MSFLPLGESFLWELFKPSRDSGKLFQFMSNQRYAGNYDTLLLVFEVFVIIYFILAFVFTEFLEIYVSGPISYVTDIWNYYEWLMIGIFFSIGNASANFKSIGKHEFQLSS